LRYGRPELRVEQVEVDMSAAHHRTVTPRLRVSDAVLRAFDYACVMRDLKTASMLLAVLADMQTRKVSRFGGDRRAAGVEFDAAYDRLRRLEAGSVGGGPTSAAGNATLY
jgi:hypothetical protein